MSNVVIPDSYLSPQGQNVAVDEAWQSLNPCPSCGAVPHDAPEGVHLDGNPRWVFEHCWKCGFRPGVNTAVDLEHLRKQFEAFQQFINQQDVSVTEGTQTALEAENQRLREQLAQSASYSTMQKPEGS